MSSESPISVTTAEDARRQLDSLLDELADLAEGASPPEEFWPELLSRLIFAASATGAAIWQVGASRRLQPLYEQGFDKVYSTAQRDVAIDIDACSLEAALRKPKASAIVSGGEQGGTARLMMAAPLEMVARTSGLLVLYQPADLPTATQNGQLRLLDAFSEIAVHYQERRLLADFAGAEQNWKNQLYFAHDIHRDLDVKRTCYRIANDGRLALDADRVSVAQWDGPVAYVQAISGIDVINRRAAVVRKLERLATAVAKQKQPIIFRGDRENLPPQIEEALVDYLEESPARLLIATPLIRQDDKQDDQPATTEGTLVGVMIVEQLEATDVERLASRTRGLAETAALALDNAQRYERLPLRGLMQLVGVTLAQFGWRKLSRTMRYVLPVLLVLLATWLIPASFEIDVRGQLQPEVERQLFAPLDGYVDEILVKHGQMVDAGQVVAKLRSPDLELKQTETAGLLAAAQSELDAVRVERTQNLRRSDDRRDSRTADREQLSADEIRLTRRIDNLQQQLELLDAQQQSLTLTAPIAGQILSWEIEETLMARPVSRGDALLKVAEVDGPWVLELEAADRRTKHILDAQAETKRPLAITFHLVSEPGVKHQAELIEVSQVIDVGSETDEPAALLTASFDKAKVDFLRPGVSVSGRVDCGTRSLAYVWTHELWEAVRRRLFW